MESRYFNFGIALLSAWRLTEIVTIDGIFNPVRTLFSKSPSITLFLQCHRCVSVWMGLISTIVAVYFPWGNWPFALSMIFLLGTRLMDRITFIPRRGITLMPTANGAHVDWGGIDPNYGIAVMKGLIAQIENAHPVRDNGGQ